MADNDERGTFDYSSSEFDREAAYAHIFAADAFAALPAKQGPQLSWSKSMADTIVDLMAHSHERRRCFNAAKTQKTKALHKYWLQAKIFAPLFLATIILSHLTPLASMKWPLLIGALPVFTLYLVYPILRLCLTAINDDPNAMMYRTEIEETEHDILRLYAYVEATHIHARNFADQELAQVSPKHLN